MTKYQNKNTRQDLLKCPQCQQLRPWCEIGPMYRGDPIRSCKECISDDLKSYTCTGCAMCFTVV
jgi:hypothetical protein